MKLIREMYDDFEILTEGKNKELKIKGVFMQAETKNRNGRLYPLKILTKASDPAKYLPKDLPKDAPKYTS